MSSDVVMDHLLHDRRQFVEDGGLKPAGEPVPDGFGGNGHNASHSVASMTNSVTLASVSLVVAAGRGTTGARWVAANGIRNRIGSR